MLVISAGMQKSGSGYIYNLINDLEISAGNADARYIKEKYNLENLMKWYNNNIGPLTFKTLFKLWLIGVKEGRFVVKTHEPPGRFAKIMSRMGLIKIIYIYRDPRDVLISAADHGRKIMDEKDHHTFAKMVEFDVGIRVVKEWMTIWDQYNSMAKVLMIKFEEMVENPVQVCRYIEDFLKISLPEKKKMEILWRYSKDNPQADRKGMHFNKAQIYRYKSEMTPDQKRECRIAFGENLKKMGYEE